MRVCIILLLVPYLNIANGTPTIKNNLSPACINCKFYKPNVYSEFASSLSRCEKFGEKNITTGKIEQDFVAMCRNDESKCGVEGKFFEEEENIDQKQFLHSIEYHLPKFFALFLFIFYSCFTQRVQNTMI
jgi:hypothetical protein